MLGASRDLAGDAAGGDRDVVTRRDGLTDELPRQELGAAEDEDAHGHIVTAQAGRRQVLRSGRDNRSEVQHHA